MKASNESVVPKALKIWFIIHFIVDTSFALPLFFVPVWFMNVLGWNTIDPITARMVAAALFGIGGESLFCLHLGRDAFTAMLTLKIIWSIAAIAGFILALVQGSFGFPVVGFGLLAVFTGFNIVWAYWRLRLKREAA